MMLRNVLVSGALVVWLAGMVPAAREYRSAWLAPFWPLHIVFWMACECPIWLIFWD